MPFKTNVRRHHLIHIISLITIKRGFFISTEMRFHQDFEDACKAQGIIESWNF